MRILILEPYFTGSHAAWAEGFANFSSHNVEILSLKGQYWKWRMHGGAVTLARKFLARQNHPDLFLATDMLDLTTFLALTREKTSRIPAAVYFHENQISYPWSPDDRDKVHKRDKHYGFINYTTALAADAVFFNSRFHLRSFQEGLPRLLKHFPDYRELESVKRISRKCSVLPLGLDLEKFDRFRPVLSGNPKDYPSNPPLILWNHRWEYDKNPSDFFRALFLLEKRGLKFNVAVLGENFSKSPDDFEEARRKLGDKVIHFGYALDLADYAGWLFKADILPVTSNQDFFGVSAAEAVYCGCYPLLPKRLSFPDVVPADTFPDNFYESFDELVDKLNTAVLDIHRIRKVDLSDTVKKYSWRIMAPQYDRMFEKVAFRKSEILAKT